jgi:hypothetical protein
MVTFVFCESAIAKKVIGYIPPPYYIRFLISFFTLAPIGIIAGGLSYYAARYFDYENCIMNRRLFLLILIVLILIGSFAGASDSFNDECWNPAMLGSVALALIIPTASLILHRRLNVAPRVIISFASLIPSLVIMEVATYSYQMYSYFELGWPTAW